MSSTVRGFAYRDLTQRGRPELGRIVVNPGKVLPATTTGNLFSVTGVVVVTALFGIVSTVFSATAVKPTLGVTGFPAAIAAAPASGIVAGTGAVGSVIIPPLTGGGALPAPVTAQTAAAGAGIFVVSAANITITTDATNSAAITWVLQYQPLYPKGAGSVAAV